jgi:tetratricopeptide (TPR) repeat protein
MGAVSRVPAGTQTEKSADWTLTERREKGFVRGPILVFLAVVPIVVAGCSQSDQTAKPSAPIRKAQTNAPATDASVPADSQPDSRGKGYTPPTAEEMAPMRPEYMAELAKIHEPPEMASKPMQVRKAVSPRVVKLGNVMNAVGSPEKATHQQRATAIRELLEFANSAEKDDGIDKVITYSAIAGMACLDGADPQTVIGYAKNAIGDNGDDALALRARMYLQAGDRNKALDDLEKVMADGDGHVLVGGDADPRKDSVPCGWSIADFDALGDDPRALAAKGLYLSSFIGYNAEAKGTVKESTIRDLYARSARSWHSPIPHVLEVTVDGFGSEHSMAGARCIRANGLSGPVPEIVHACVTYDEGTRQEIRELTMALVIEPTFARALSARANKYLQLAQSSYADGKPSRHLFELAIKDFDAALATDGRNHILYCDRALALASIGRYQDAASGYMQGMKYAKNGVEDDPFVYEQLANLYMKLGKFNEAADLITQAIMNASGGGIDTVIFGGGIRALRILYPEYDVLPDEILAEAMRRRYHPQFPQSWDADFISEAGAFKGKIASSILVELFVMRGDAYMKAGRRAEALADYRRGKSDAWSGDEPSLPRHMYFNERGMRNFDLPEPWPPPPPTM